MRMVLMMRMIFLPVVLYFELEVFVWLVRWLMFEEFSGLSFLGSKNFFPILCFPFIYVPIFAISVNALNSLNLLILWFILRILLLLFRFLYHADIFHLEEGRLIVKLFWLINKGLFFIHHDRLSDSNLIIVLVFHRLIKIYNYKEKINNL